MKTEPLPASLFTADIAAHHAGKPAGDGEPEAGAAEAAGGRGLRLGEFLEQLRLLFRRHADAGVADGEFDPRCRRRSGAAQR